MLKPEQLRYLTEVLGVETVLRPEGLAVVTGGRAQAPESARPTASGRVPPPRPAFLNAQSPAGSSSRGQTAEPTAPAPGPAPAAPVASERRMRLMDGRPEAPFVFFVKTRNMAFNGGPEHEMLIRIATAMKLETKQFCIVSAVDGDDAFDFVSEHRNRVGVFFAGTDAGSIKKHDGCVVLYTYTLQQLLEDASLKKSTWAGLQEIMKAAQ